MHASVVTFTLLAFSAGPALAAPVAIEERDFKTAVLGAVEKLGGYADDAWKAGSGAARGAWTRIRPMKLNTAVAAVGEEGVGAAPKALSRVIGSKNKAAQQVVRRIRGEIMAKEAAVTAPEIGFLARLARKGDKEARTFLNNLPKDRQTEVKAAYRAAGSGLAKPLVIGGTTALVVGTTGWLLVNFWGKEEQAAARAAGFSEAQIEQIGEAVDEAKESRDTSAIDRLIADFSAEGATPEQIAYLQRQGSASSTETTEQGEVSEEGATQSYEDLD